MRMKRRFVSLLLASIVAVSLTTMAVSVQQTFDRSRIPSPAKATALRVPTWTKSTLANGAEFIVYWSNGNERLDL